MCVWVSVFMCVRCCTVWCVISDYIFLTICQNKTSSFTSIKKAWLLLISQKWAKLVQVVDSEGCFASVSNTTVMLLSNHPHQRYQGGQSNTWTLMLLWYCRQVRFLQMFIIFIVPSMNPASILGAAFSICQAELWTLFLTLRWSQKLGFSYRHFIGSIIWC